MSYRIKLDIFEGPLDLLLHLVKKNEVELSDIPVATITDQYLAYLGLLQQLDLDVAGEYLVMAATLLHLKTRLLLPEEETSEEEEQHGDRGRGTECGMRCAPVEGFKHGLPEQPTQGPRQRSQSAF